MAAEKILKHCAAGTLVDFTALALLSSAELGCIDGVTLGTGAASKALTLDASGNGTLGTGTITVSTLKVTTLQDNSGNTMNTAALDTTATATELNYTDLTTLGTVQASKAWTADASGNTNLPAATVLKGASNTMATVDASGNLYFALGALRFTDASGNAICKITGIDASGNLLGAAV